MNRETGNRLRQQLVDTVTGEVVASHNKGRGYEVGENDFLIVENEELKAAEQEARVSPFSPTPSEPTQPPRQQPRRSSAPLKLAEPEYDEAPPIVSAAAPPRPIIENTRTIELDRFVQQGQIDAGYFDKPYYVVPRDEVGQETFAVIRDAMAAKGLVGLGRVVLANRERPILVEPMGNGLRGITLRYTHEVRDHAEYFSDIPQLTLPDEMLRITEHILETKTQDFDPAYLEDRYRTVLVEKLREKHAQKPARDLSPARSAQNVINLMDALKRSLAATRPMQKAANPAGHTAGPTSDIIKPSPRRAAQASKQTSAKRPAARARKAS